MFNVFFFFFDPNKYKKVNKILMIIVFYKKIFYIKKIKIGTSVGENIKVFYSKIDYFFPVILNLFLTYFKYIFLHFKITLL